MEQFEKLLDLLELWDETREEDRVSLEEFCREQPGLLDDFRNLLRQRGVLSSMLNGEDSPALAPEAMIERLQVGRFPAVKYHDKGGLGWVYVANDSELGRTVALKCLQPNPATDPASRQRFIREAEITARLEHPGIVPIYGLGTSGISDAGLQPLPSYAMRFIQGATLRDTIRQFHAGHSKIDWRSVEGVRILRSFVNVCETIAFAHSKNVIHRDLKSANIMLGAFGETLVLDWGLAKLLHDTVDMGIDEGRLHDGTKDFSVTQTGSTLGTVGFMSPEQASGERDKVDAASDIFSLGAILYQIVTNQPPYSGDQALEAARACAFQPPLEVNPGIPKSLAAICQKAMQSEPSQRYASALNLKNDIECYLADEPITARQESLSERFQRTIRKHRAIVQMAAVMSIAAIVTLSAFLSFSADKNRKLAAANLRENAAKEEAIQERDRANNERDLAKIERDRADVKAAEARQLAGALYNMLNNANPLNHDGPYLLADWIEDSLSSDAFFADLSPAYEGQLRLQFAEMLNHLDRQKESVPHYRQAIELLSKSGGLFDQVGQARRQLAIVLSSKTAGWTNYPERFEEAQNLLKENIESEDISPIVRRASSNRLAQCLNLEGKTTEAERVIVKLLREFESLDPPEPYGHAEAKKFYCYILDNTKRFEQAIPILREILEHPPAEMPQSALDETRYQLARSVCNSGPKGSAEAIQIYEDLFKRYLERYARPTHAAVLTVSRELANRLILDAQPQRLLDNLETHYGTIHVDDRTSLSLARVIGAVQVARAQIGKAESSYQEGIVAIRHVRSLQPMDDSSLLMQIILAKSMAMQELSEQALPIAKEVYSLVSVEDAPTETRYLRALSLNVLYAINMILGNQEEAEAARAKLPEGVSVPILPDHLIHPSLRKPPVEKP